MPTAHHSRMLVQHLESLQAAGVQQLPQARPTTLATATGDDAAHSATDRCVARSVAGGGAARLVGDSQEMVDMNQPANMPVSKAPSLEVLQAEVAQCVLCDELASTRTQTVFGVGNPQARLCLLGEAPGAEEDRQGEPFVGRAGQLLSKILDACQLRRDDVYILNVLKCRPPGNRNPTPDEAQNCRRFLDRQLQLIQPEFICCMGAVAAQNLLSTTTPIGRLRGELHDYQGTGVVCTYHPAYLLRNPSAKAKTWDDMKLLMRQMGINL